MRILWTMIFKEIRQTFRVLAKSPGFTVIAALSLAIGIGANTAIFSLADALLLRPLPVRDASEIVTVSSSTPNDPYTNTSYPDYLDFREKSRSFDGITAFGFYRLGLSTSPTAQAQMRVGFLVSDNFFRVLGVEPALGRGFLPGEAQVPGRDNIAVLSHDLWTNQFSGDRSVIGRVIRLNGIDFTVIGVAPQSFTGLDPFIRPALYVPATMSQRLEAAAKDPLADRGSRRFDLKARLKSGVSREQAQAELIGIAKNLAAAYPDTNRNFSAKVQTELQARIQQDPYDSALAGMMMALVGLVLLIACANVANLLLSRARTRSREIAIRLAMGVSRTRLIRQLLTESFVLALSGALLGLGLAYAGIRFLKGIPMPTDLPVVIGVQLDRRVLLYSLFAAVASALIFGIVPAWQAVRTDLIAGLRSAGLSSSARRRTVGRNALVVGQVAFSLVLLVAAAMLLDGFRKALVLDPGFRTDHVMLMEVDTDLVRYTPEQSRQFFRNLVDRSGQLRGVRSVALAQSVPMAPGHSGMVIAPEGYQLAKGQEMLTVLGEMIDEHYFDLLKMPILRGRAFTAADKAEARPVAIVNEAFAQKYWPKQDPIGKRLRLKDRNGPMAEVVGLAKTSRYLFISESPFPYVYLPYAQNPSGRMTLYAESYGDPAELAAPLRGVVKSLDANIPIYNNRTLGSFYEQRAIGVVLIMLELVAAMGLLGLALALIGLYGLIAYSVSRRTQEIGIRMALGAHRWDVLKMVLRQGFLLSVIGVVIGLVASLGVRRLLAIGLVGLGDSSPAVLAIVPLALILVSMAACYLPARRASQIDPIRALRWE